MRCRLIGCLLLLFWKSVVLQAQNILPLSVGITVGAANYSGDLSYRAIELKQTKPALGATGMVGFNRFLWLRLSGIWFTLSASDADADDPIRNARNLSFRSRIWEGSAQVVVTLPLSRQVAPYLCGGVAVFGFNPKAKYQGEWVALQPLGTEGQGLGPAQMRTYRRSSWALPAGAGLRLKSGKHLEFFLEAAYRKTFTDYIDDVSGNYYSQTELLQKRAELAAALANRSAEVIGENNLFPAGSVRGNPKYNDGYYLLTFTAAWQLGSSESSRIERCYGF